MGNGCAPVRIAPEPPIATILMQPASDPKPNVTHPQQTVSNDDVVSSNQLADKLTGVFSSSQQLVCPIGCVGFFLNCLIVLSVELFFSRSLRWNERASADTRRNQMG